MAKIKNDSMTLTLPDIGEGGDITAGVNTMAAAAEMLVARGAISLVVRPIPKLDEQMDIRICMQEVRMMRSDIDDIRDNHYVDVILEGMGEKDHFAAVQTWHLSGLGDDSIIRAFPKLSKEQAKMLNPLISGILETAGDLEREAEKERQGGLKHSKRDLVDMLAKRVIAAREAAEKPGLKIKLKS